MDIIRETVITCNGMSNKGLFKSNIKQQQIMFIQFIFKIMKLTSDAYCESADLLLK